MTDHPVISVFKVLLIGFVMFLISAVIEAFIQVWVFKRWGGCPMAEKQRVQL